MSRFAVQLLGCALSLCVGRAWAQLTPPSTEPPPASVPADSMRDGAFVLRQRRFSAALPFIRYDRNAWRWTQPSAVAGIFRALAKADSERVTIVHIGDSHVQADFYPNIVRNRMQELFGAGGRGMMFPYAAARTHAGSDYLTYHHGPWAFAKNIHPEPILPLGLTGYTIHTRDVRAGFKLAFTELANLAGNTRLRIWLHPSPKSFDLRVFYGDPDPILLRPGTDTTVLFVEALLPYPPTDLQVLLAPAADSISDRLEIYGVSLDVPTDRGVLYHSVGVNGATFDAVLRQQLMDEELVAIAPNLVVLDISGNEYYGRSFDPIDFSDKLRTSIRRIRRSAPRASILITCSQDIFRRYWNVAATTPAAAVAQQVAAEMGCVFYDYFTVSGGAQSMLKWRDFGLAKRDRVHLTADGYRIKGELFVNALLTSYAAWLKGDSLASDSALAMAGIPESGTAPESIMAPRITRSAAPPLGATLPRGVPTVHIVRSGEVLGLIAQRYHLSVMAIRSWNNLRSNTIYAGQKLVLYLNGSPPPRVVAKASSAPAKVSRPPAATSSRSTAAPNTRIHVVRSGESLWTIAQKYGTTSGKLRSLNALKSDDLRPGQKLKLP